MTAMELAAVRDVERAAGIRFVEIGMPEIAADETPSIDDLARYQRAGMAWVAADDSDSPVGYLLADRVDGNLHVEQVSVLPDHAGRRIGRRLLEHLADQGRATGVPALTLTTFALVPWNAPYYRRCGFRVLENHELTPGLVAIREYERARGLDKWPRVCMLNALAESGHSAEKCRDGDGGNTCESNNFAGRERLR